AVAFLPRRKSPLQLAALTGAILIGFELVLTHWFYLYLPWFFAFAAYAVLAAEPSPAPEQATVRGEHAQRELVPASGLPARRGGAAARDHPVRWGLVGDPLRLLPAQSHRRYTDLPAIRRRDRERPRSLSRLPARVPPGGATGVRAALSHAIGGRRPGRLPRGLRGGDAVLRSAHARVHALDPPQSGGWSGT